MRVVFATSEVQPFSKTGGLADVSYSLPKCLKKEGIDVIVISPLYKSIDVKKFNISFTNLQINVFIDRKWETGKIYKAELDNIEFYFIENRYFDVESYYDGEDVGVRFGFFSYGVLETVKALNFEPDIIHINDWQLGMLPVILKINYSNERIFHKTKVVITIHNLAYQGYFSKDILYKLNLPDYLFNPEQLEFYNQVNFLKAGILFSDFITTVSPTYAKEILEPIAGWGLDGVLRKRKDRIVGILNGIDEEIWNPEKDKFLFKNYNSESLEYRIENKLKLQEVLNFEKNEDIILFGFVGRLTYQKGIEYIINVIDELMKLNVQLVILGKGERYYEEKISEKIRKYMDKISLNLQFNEELAHKIYAGIDFLIMPSVYEPCGLTQMISLKYGAIPIARKVGGLVDTINDINNDRKKATGILFENLDLKEFSSAIIRGIKLFYTEKDKLIQMQKKGMNADFSWEKSCKEYIKLYRRLEWE